MDTGRTGDLPRRSFVVKYASTKIMAVSDANKDTTSLPTLTRCMDGMVLFVW